MAICSTGSTALVALIFALLLAFSAAAPEPRSPAPPLAPTRRSSPPPPPQWPPPPPPRKQLNSLPGNTSKTKKRRGLNFGKKLGLSFAGIAVIMQFGVLGFLAYKRNQLYKLRD